MKWVVSLLLLLSLFFLWKKGSVESRGGVEVVKSTRVVYDKAWRAQLEGEMTIREMERYAAGLSDEELWEALESAYGDWFEKNGGRKRFDQPKLAIMLTREVGKRDREAGMKKVAEWLKELGEFAVGIDDALAEEREFGDLRVLMAGYAGWVSEDPEEAIERLIESRLNEEEDWPVVNQGFMMYIKVPDYFAVEEVLRDGFARISQSDLVKAQELLAGGIGLWAFDANEILGSVLGRIPEDEWVSFLDLLNADVLDQSEAGLDGASSDGFEGFLRKEIWFLELQDLLNEEKFVGGGYYLRHSSVFARGRPEDAVAAMTNGQVDDETKRWLFVRMSMADTKHYHLLSQLSDAGKVRAVDSLLASGEYTFGPITGAENPGALDLDELLDVVKDTAMADETRETIDSMLRSWEE